ncbi:MAG: hypothetical protein JRD68_04855 [Deltaproteobacteria bacterium]|nr:hypothetical protein [Deltaproteobacteria bacterium]
MNGSSAQTWRVDLQCPQCGAPTTIGETDHLFTCSYCRVNLYLTAKDFPRYYIPAKSGNPEKMIFVPYWRYKGMFFSWATDEIYRKIIDTNRLALNLDIFPQSLGMRPQTQKLEIVSPDTKGNFLKPHLTVESAAASIETQQSRQHLPDNAESVLHHSFVGETISLIYTPYYYKQRTFYDAILDKPVGSATPAQMQDDLIKDRPENWAPGFLPTMCPDCGWDLALDKKSLILLCRNCHTAWRASSGVFQKHDFSVLSEPDKAEIYLPFWRIKAESEEVALETYADLIALANWPRAITQEWRKLEFFFWTPAFKIRPLIYLRLSKEMSLFQPNQGFRKTIPDEDMYPVTLPVSEAAESLIVCLVNMAVSKKKMVDILPESTIEMKDFSLVYVPFSTSGSDFVYAEKGMSINRNTLKYAREL